VTKKEREFVKLCWWLIERKVAYYRPEAVHASWKPILECSDDDYDAAEQRYLTLCRELERDNTIVHKGYPGFEDVPGAGMMEVDETRQSVKVVIGKLGLDEQTRRPPRERIGNP
jgi:hypothetical protein